MTATVDFLVTAPAPAVDEMAEYFECTGCYWVLTGEDIAIEAGWILAGYCICRRGDACECEHETRCEDCQ